MDWLHLSAGVLDDALPGARMNAARVAIALLVNARRPLRPLAPDHLVEEVSFVVSGLLLLLRYRGGCWHF